MTTHEFRLDLYKQGFILQEGVRKDNILEILIIKIDTDGLRFECRIHPSENIYYKSNNHIFVETLRNETLNINNLIAQRHAQNINNCDHEMTMIGSRKGCTKCMGYFGERIVQDLNFN